MPWITGADPIAFSGFGAAENKGIAFGGLSHNVITLQSWTEGASLWRGGHIASGTFFARILYLTALLLLVPDTRVLTIAHVESQGMGGP